MLKLQSIYIGLMFYFPFKINLNTFSKVSFKYVRYGRAFPRYTYGVF